MKNKLELSSFEKAVQRLSEGLDRFNLNLDDDQIRDGLVQRFEFTYEISHKMLKRYLENASANPEEIDQLDFQSLIRTGSEQGLLKGDWPAWRIYRDQRAKSSHTYDQQIALQVVSIIPKFLEEAKFLLSELKQRNG